MRLNYLYLSLIILLAIGLRFYHLTTVPSGFLNDEAAMVDNA